VNTREAVDHRINEVTLISKNGDNINWALEYVLATPRRLRERPQCGAKTRSGAPCKNAATIISRRCRMHGGAGSGAPLGNKNALKHGFFTREAIEARRKMAELKRAAASQEENSIWPEPTKSRSKAAADFALMRDALAGLSREPAATEGTTAAESNPISDQIGRNNTADANDDIDALVGPEETERILARLRQDSAAGTAQRRDATAKAGRTSVAAHRNSMIEMMVCVADEGNRRGCAEFVIWASRECSGSRC
jgi:glucans biosynthesis protein